MATTIVKGSIQTDRTGARLELPIVVTAHGVLEPLLDYFISRAHDRSLKWMRGVARAVCLFLEYLETKPDDQDTYRLFLNFGQRLYLGSHSRDTGEDPSGLGWLPMRSDQAGRITTALTEFFDYLAVTRPAAAQLNPKYAGGAHDRMVDEAAYQYQRSKAMLGHTWATSLEASGHTAGRLYRSRRSLSKEASTPPSFPEEEFVRLLTEGFRVGERHDYRAILITVLLHCAGFRESEPFHLYFGDVVSDPNNVKSALVLIQHPSDGAAPSDWRDAEGKRRKGTRRAYLHERYALLPRNEALGNSQAGWKGAIHESDLGGLYLRAYWFEPWWGEFFLTVWWLYLKQVAVLHRPHPFAFVNTNRMPIGGMYKLSQYNKAHARAVRRIGLEVSKAAGTTPHGHRHAYGQRLSKAGISRELIRRFMHHSTLSSQECYTAPSIEDALAELRLAADRLTEPIYFQPPILE